MSRKSLNILNRGKNRLPISVNRTEKSDKFNELRISTQGGGSSVPMMRDAHQTIQVVSFTDANSIFNTAKKQMPKTRASLSQMSLTNYNRHEISVLGKNWMGEDPYKVNRPPKQQVLYK